MGAAPINRFRRETQVNLEVLSMYEGTTLVPHHHI